MEEDVGKGNPKTLLTWSSPVRKRSGPSTQLVRHTWGEVKNAGPEGRSVSGKRIDRWNSRDDLELAGQKKTGEEWASGGKKGGRGVHILNRVVPASARPLAEILFYLGKKLNQMH